MNQKHDRQSPSIYSTESICHCTDKFHPTSGHITGGGGSEVGGGGGGGGGGAGVRERDRKGF